MIRWTKRVRVPRIRKEMQDFCRETRRKLSVYEREVSQNILRRVGARVWTRFLFSLQAVSVSRTRLHTVSCLVGYSSPGWRAVMSGV